MPQQPKPTYVHVGSDGKNHTFTLKPTSRKNRSALKEYIADFQGKVQLRFEALKLLNERAHLMETAKTEGLPDDVEIPEEPLVPEEVDETEFWLGLFKLLTIGKHDILDPDDFDIKLAEQAKEDFLPASAKMTSALLQYFD